MNTVRLCAFSDEAAQDFDAQIQALKRNGITLMELRSINGANISDISEMEAEIYAHKLKIFRIRVWSIGSPLGKSDVRENFSLLEARARHIFRLANIFSCKRVRIFSFIHANQERALVFTLLTRLVGIANEYGVTLCHENEKEIFGDTVSHILELARHVQGLSFVYDPANFIQVNEKIDNAMSRCSPMANYFHIKDICLSGEIVPAGEGDAKIEKLLDRLTGTQVLSLEPHLVEFIGYREIDGTQMLHRYTFSNGNEAFDVAVKSLKILLEKTGYKEIKLKGEIVWKRD